MIIRYKYLKQIKGQLKIHKVCALLGPRQCGKTTLSRQFAEENNIPQSNIFDIENYAHLERLYDQLLTL